MEFERVTRRKMRALNLTPLIDVLFILIIFFMLTTSFMKIESMELNLPAAGAAKSAVKQEVVRVFLSANGDITLGSRKLNQDDLAESLTRMLETNPDIRVMLLTADGVSMQQLVSVMDRVYMIGGKSLFVRRWNKKG